MSVNIEGLIVGVFAFLIIGIFHPIVIKTEYYFGISLWWVFLLLGIVGGVASLFVSNNVASICIGITAFCCFWSIGELFQQKKRVEKGWFPRNLKRHYIKKSKGTTKNDVPFD